MIEKTFSLVKALELPTNLNVPSHSELLNELTLLEKAFGIHLKVSTDGESRKGKKN